MNDPVPFLDFLRARIARGPLAADEALAAFLPLVLQTVRAHESGRVAPLEGAARLKVDGVRIYFEEALLAPPQLEREKLRRIEEPLAVALDVIAESRTTTEVDAGTVRGDNLLVGKPGEEPRRPVFLPAYSSWELAIGHHDPPADLFVLGLLLASLACGLDLTDADDFALFVAHRKNLFKLHPGLHPVLAQTIVRMTEVDRHARAQDLPGVLHRLETYREQDAGFEVDLARVPGFHEKDRAGKRQAVLARLRERLFEISRRNRLLYFRPTSSHLNLTEASVPLLFDLRSIRPEQLMTWQPEIARQLATGDPLPLGRWLRFEDAPYLPGALDKILAEARRDLAEFGFAQLRLVICFLRWHNLKEGAPEERIDSPLLLLPVRLTKKKGVRDSYLLQAAEREAEVNPVLRHHLRELYGIRLPETLDLSARTVDEFHAFLVEQIRASEPGVTLTKVDRPQVHLVHERAKRRLERFRRRERLAGRGVHTHLDLDYSYDRDNFHPLGLRLFQARVRPSPARLRDLLEDGPRPRASFAEEAAHEKERQVAVFGAAATGNPYAWEFDLCNLTLGNFKYRKMSLVRDYEALLDGDSGHPAFESIFSLAPREPALDGRESPPLEERWPVVACDPTQAQAIGAARAGKSYVIQGPPGTGKSQTITNLVADYVARGKKVLFVAEKRAAIDVVFHRLRQHGLDELCCLIHDTQGDKKEFIQDLKRTYEGWLAPAAEGGDAEKERAERVKALRKELDPLEQFDATMRTTSELAAVSTRALLHRAVELTPRRPVQSAAEKERLPHYALWAQSREPLSRFHAALAEAAPDGVFARHPLRLLAGAVLQEARPMETLRARVERAGAALQAVERALADTGLPRADWESMDRALRLGKYAAHVHFLARRRLLGTLDVASDAARRLKSQIEAQRRRASALSKARESTVGWKTKLPEGELAIALEQARAVEAAWIPFLRSAWWSLRAALQQRYEFSIHAIAPTWVQILEALAQEYRASAALADGDRQAQAELGIEESLDAFLARIQEVRAAEPKLPPALAELHRRLVASSAGDATVEKLFALHPALDALEREMAGVLDPFRDRALPDLAVELARVAGAIDGLPDFLPCLTELCALPRPLAEAVRALPLDAAALEAAMADKSLEEIYRADRSLQRFTGAVRERHLTRLESLYADWEATNARCVRDRIRRAFLERVRLSSLPAAQLSDEEKIFKKRYAGGRKELEHEFGKTMRYRSIRDLLAGPSGEVLQDLKPVWLMSPLSVSDTLPLDRTHFDVVIFDEASQVPLEDSVPSVFRSAQVIVVGDEMQLPPTAFFTARRGGDVEDEGGEEAAVDAGLESSSFLNHAARNLPSTLLGWHYRSRSESLIGFSNAVFYQGRLLTVPESALPVEGLGEIVASAAEEGEPNVARLLERSLSFHFMEKAVYVNRRNAREAGYIAHLVKGLLAAPGRPSVGVVAFSEAQQEEIESALGALASKDAAFAERLEAEWEREENGQFCGLLVKNLENIQGDERDAVILSVCYGPGPDGRTLMNFGPINQSGGEKRLNVAFSRAKRHMAVVASMRHGAITNEYNDGANCLRNYLRYSAAASAGDLISVRRVLEELLGRRAAAGEDARATDAVVEQLAAQLTARGWIVDRRVGLSHFRCDLAARRPEERAYRAGILVDTLEHYAQGDVLARDLMKPGLLRAFGWRVLHVLAKDWYEDPCGVMKRVEAGLGEGETD